MKKIFLPLLLIPICFTGCSVVSSDDLEPNEDAFLVGVFINRTFPEDWTYIPDDPNYPDPSWCKSSPKKEWKLKLVGMGVTSPLFEARDDINIEICIESIGKVNETDVDQGIEHVFLIEGLDSNKEIKSYTYVDEKEISSYKRVKASLSASNIVQIRFTMVGYYHSGVGAIQALGVSSLSFIDVGSNI